MAQTQTTTTGVTSRAKRRGRLVNRSRLYLALYLLVLPTFAGMIVFNYYPKFSAIRYSLYRWDGGTTIEEFRGLQNFVKIFTADALFWRTFGLVGILLVANLIKMWPCIFTAIALHRLRSKRWQYIYRVLFVIPMVIPALVGLLIWKSFYHPQVGILNALLKGTGLITVLQRMDVAMPKLAASLEPVLANVVDPVFGSVWGMGMAGFLLLGLVGGVRGMLKGWGWWMILLGFGCLVWWPASGGMPWRLLLTLGAAVTVSQTIRRRGVTGADTIKWMGLALLGVAFALVLAAKVWVSPTHAFDTGSPSWLGHSMLVIPALVFWGFPWVGTVGVLIYLSGLQNISEDVYEAAEIDGVGSLGKMFRIELPLIMTQVRINLIFMTIATLNSYGLVLILLGPGGGPDNRGMVPGLYMFREAFYNQRYGYACALGMVMFVILLGITVLYTKYVKVEK